MTTSRWCLEVELDEPLLVPPAVGIEVAVRGAGLHQRGRVRRVVSLAEGPAGAAAPETAPLLAAAGDAGAGHGPVLAEPGRAPGPAAALRFASERLRLLVEGGAAPDHPVLRAAADAALLWADEDPVAACGLDLMRARCLLAGLQADHAMRALRPWCARLGLPLVLRAEVMTTAALAAAESGATAWAVEALDEARVALERRPRSCAAGRALAAEIASLRAQLWVESGEPSSRGEQALIDALGPPAAWRAVPEDAAAPAELSLLRWLVAGGAPAALREAVVRRHARWVPRIGGEIERRVSLLRAVLLDEEGLPREAEVELARVSGPSAQVPRAHLLSLAAWRMFPRRPLGAGGAGPGADPAGSGWTAAADALARACPGSAPVLSALRGPAPVPRRLWLSALPVGLR